MKRLVLVAALLALGPALALGENWPQFRGDSGGSVSSDTALPDHWDLENNLLWKVRLPGLGSSSPIILNDRVYLTCYSGYGTGEGGPDQKNLVRHLVCLERKNGSEIWKADIHTASREANYGGMMAQHGYASNTPATDGKKIFVFLGTGGVHAFDMQGKELWKQSVGNGTDQWGSASSVRLSGDVVIVNAAIESGAVVALNKENGKEAWRFPVNGRSWSTPALVETDAGKQELVISTEGQISGLDPQTGKKLWSCEGIQDYTCPSVTPGKGIAYVCGGRQSSLIAVRVGGSGDVTKTHVLWRARIGANVPTPVLYQGHLFGVSDRGGIAYCVNAETGAVDYQKRLSLDEMPVKPVAYQPPPGGGRGGRRGGMGRGGPGGGGPGGGPGGFGGGGGFSFYASTVAADGKIFAVSRSSGVLVLAAKPDFELLARNQFEGDKGPFDGTPAICDGQIFIRSNGNLYCVGKK